MRKRLQVCVAMLLVAGTGWTQTNQDSVQQDTKSAPPTYNLLYQVQQKKKTTSAVSGIYTSDLQKTVSTTFGGWLTGRLAGLYTIQPSGEPGGDDVSLLLRGQTPLVLIDGTPQSFPSINPEQIESITLLKDAVATAMLGLRSSGGAILITTKKGARNSGQHLAFTAQYGIQRPTQLPKYLSAYNYATLYNEALANTGQSALYSAADLEAYRTGSDPIGHPDVNWQKEVLEKQAPFSRYDLTITGGNATTRYFVNLDYLHQEGLLKKEDFNIYNTNADYKRYMVRSNIEVDLTKSITAALNLTGRIQNTNQPGANTASIFNALGLTPNNAHPVRNSDSSMAGTLNYQSNPYGLTVMSGYRPGYERDFKADLSLRANLDGLVKGLWIKGLAALNAYQRESINRSKTFATFRQSTDGLGNKSYTRYTTASDQANTASVNSLNRLFYTEISAGYSKQLRSNDNLTALVIANNDYRMINGDLPFSYSGLAAKISYDHQDKYFVDLAMSYNGTERLPKANRYGFFPAVGLAWNITKESFFKHKPGWLDDLKLRASFGKTGNANFGYYDYFQYYVNGTGYGFGATIPATNTTLMQGALANPNLSFEKADKFSAGIDAAFFNNRLQLTIDYFNDKYTDLVQPRADGSDIFGADFMRENIGRNHFTGLEVQANWQDTKGAFSYFIAPNFTVQRGTVLYAGESGNLPGYLMRAGKQVYESFGYMAEGLFNSTEEIANHAFQGNTILPGDIKYKDINGDHIIDTRDQTVIANGLPTVLYGLATGVTCKGIDLHLLIQGIAGFDKSMTAYRAFQNNGLGQAYEYQLNRWTPSNTTNPGYPRLWLGNNTNNNLNSSYWLRSADYLRLKSVELGYSLPHSLSGKIKLEVVRIFVNASNLLTFSGITDLDIDPESVVGGYPLMKTMNAGITIKF